MSNSIAERSEVKIAFSLFWKLSIVIFVPVPLVAAADTCLIISGVLRTHLRTTSSHPIKHCLIKKECEKYMKQKLICQECLILFMCDIYVCVFLYNFLLYVDELFFEGDKWNRCH